MHAGQSLGPARQQFLPHRLWFPSKTEGCEFCFLEWELTSPNPHNEPSLKILEKVWPV